MGSRLIRAERGGDSDQKSVFGPNSPKSPYP